jgi:uncharacterized protein (DUF58 family)
MPAIRPTRRGLAVLALAVVATASAVGFGPRALDALVLSAAVVLVAAVVQVARLDAPSVERRPPAGGPPDTTTAVSLRFSTPTPFTARVTDTLPPGLAGDGEVTALVGEGTVAYDVTYRERGVHAVGPVRVAARDVLGLVERTFVDEARTPVVVYPPVYYPGTALAERLTGLATRARHGERGAFDHLREYVRGDSLRDVHWKSSAKRDALVVQEFVDDTDRAVVRVAASADAGRADAMAEAAAAVCVALLADGVAVALTTPHGTVRAGPDDVDALLDHLARVGDGDVPEADDADVVVAAGAETTIRVDGETAAFARERRRPVDAGGGRDAAADRRASARRGSA